MTQTSWTSVSTSSYAGQKISTHAMAGTPMAAAAGICARRMQMYRAEGLSVRKIDYDVRIAAPEEASLRVQTLGFRP